MGTSNSCPCSCHDAAPVQVQLLLVNRRCLALPFRWHQQRRVALRKTQNLTRAMCQIWVSGNQMPLPRSKCNVKHGAQPIPSSVSHLRLCSWRFCCRLFLHCVVPPRRTWLGPWIYWFRALRSGSLSIPGTQIVGCW